MAALLARLWRAHPTRAGVVFRLTCRRRLVLLAGLLAGAQITTTSTQAEEPVSFRRDIARVLLDNCLACHGPKKAEGGYRVDSYEHATAEGDSLMPGFYGGDLESSEAYRRIASDDPAERMPWQSDPLPSETVALIKRWIEQGASFDGQDPAATLATIIPPPTHPEPPAHYPHSLPVTALAFSPDGSQLVASGYHELTVWRATDGQLQRRITNVPQRVYAIEFSPDGTLIAAAGGSPGRAGEVRTYDAGTGELRQVLSSTSDVIQDIAFSPSGEQLASAGADSVLRIFDVASSQLQLQITSHSDWITGLAYSADGTRIASASRDQTVKVFDIQTGQLLASYSDHGEPVYGVAFHPDGNSVYSGGADKQIHLWKVKDGKKSAEMKLGGEVHKLRLAGEFLFATSAEQRVRQYMAQDQKAVRDYGGHEDWVLATAYAAEHERLASGSFDGEIRVWNTADGSLVTAFDAVPR